MTDRHIDRITSDSIFKYAKICKLNIQAYYHAADKNYETLTGRRNVNFQISIIEVQCKTAIK